MHSHPAVDEDDFCPRLAKVVILAISWELAWIVVDNCPTGFSGDSDDGVQVEFGPSTLNGVAGTSHFIFYTTKNL